MTKNPSVLLVEDSPDDAYFFRRALRETRLSCDFEHVVDGKEAIELLQRAIREKRRHPDVLFLDLKMPVMNGFEVLEWLQRERVAAEFPVYVLSGSNQQEDRERARVLGAFGYLVKPISAEELGKRLQPLVKTEGGPP